MGIRKGIEFVLVVALAFGLTNCGNGSSSSNSDSGSNGNTSQKQAAVSISFQPAPPATVTIIDTAQLTAVVQNDSNDYGVDWCVTASGSVCGQCPPSTCGGFSALHTHSGQPTTYSPPTTFKGNNQSVQIVAFATADHTKNAVSTITVSGFLGRLAGKYVFYAKGTFTDPQTSVVYPYHTAGVVSLDGAGGLSTVNINGQMIAGEQSYTSSTKSGSAHITAGSYTISADGRGVLTLVTDDPTLGANGTEIFSLASVSNSQVFVAEVDGPGFAGYSASGSMDLQTATTAPTGSYAFALGGSDSLGTPMAIGGVLNIDQPNGGISGNQSVADQAYASLGVVSCPAPQSAGDAPGLTGKVGTPDAFGMIQLSLTPSCFSGTSIQFTGYVQDAAHFKLIESDLNLQAGTGYAVGGPAIGRGAASGTSGAQALSGNFVFAISGLDTSTSLVSLTSAGTLQANATGTVSGFSDEMVASGIAVSDNYSGNYTVDPSGTGRVGLPLTFTNNSGVSTPNLILYLNTTGTPLLAIDSDPTAQVVGTGVLFPQASPPIAFAGNYAFRALNQNNPGIGVVDNDMSGRMTADSSRGTLTGSIDEPSGYGQGGTNLNAGASEFSGTFETVSNTGRFTGTLSAPSTYILAIPAQVAFYPVDSGHGVFIETDLGSPLLLGYFASVTPVCPSCP